MTSEPWRQGWLALPERHARCRTHAIICARRLLLTSQELATAVELRLSLPIVIWNNSALGQIRDDMVAAGIPPTGVSGHNPDFLALARAYGAHAQRARGPEELTAAIRSALQRRGPTVLEAVEADFSSG
jgi:5-guanidino-2-oxopentanoate decarboxylase